MAICTMKSSLDPEMTFSVTSHNWPISNSFNSENQPQFYQFYWTTYVNRGPFTSPAHWPSFQMQVLNVEKQEFTLKKNKNNSQLKEMSRNCTISSLDLLWKKTNVLHWKRKSREDSARLVLTCTWLCFLFPWSTQNCLKWLCFFLRWRPEQ